MILTAIIGRVGRQTYLESEIVENGLSYKTVQVDRPLKVVKDSLHLMKNLPITTDHDNYEDLNVGFVIDTWMDENNHINAVMNIKDGITPKGFSIGYDAEILPTGDEYFMNLIIPTHVALVENPRCGKACKL